MSRGRAAADDSDDMISWTGPAGGADPRAQADSAPGQGGPPRGLAPPRRTAPGPARTPRTRRAGPDPPAGRPQKSWDFPEELERGLLPGGPAAPGEGPQLVPAPGERPRPRPGKAGARRSPGAPPGEGGEDSANQPAWSLDSVDSRYFRRDEQRAGALAEAKRRPWTRRGHQWTEDESIRILVFFMMRGGCWSEAEHYFSSGLRANQLKLKISSLLRSLGRSAGRTDGILYELVRCATLVSDRLQDPGPGAFAGVPGDPHLRACVLENIRTMVPRDDHEPGFSARAFGRQVEEIWGEAQRATVSMLSSSGDQGEGPPGSGRAPRRLQKKFAGPGGSGGPPSPGSAGRSDAPGAQAWDAGGFDSMGRSQFVPLPADAYAALSRGPRPAGRPWGGLLGGELPGQPAEVRATAAAVARGLACTVPLEDECLASGISTMSVQDMGQTHSDLLPGMDSSTPMAPMHACAHLPLRRLSCDLVVGARAGPWKIPAALRNPVFLVLPLYQRDLCSLPMPPAPRGLARAATPADRLQKAVIRASMAVPGVQIVLPTTYVCRMVDCNVILWEAVEHARRTEAFLARQAEMRDAALAKCTEAVAYADARRRGAGPEIPSGTESPGSDRDAPRPSPALSAADLRAALQAEIDAAAPGPPSPPSPGPESSSDPGPRWAPGPAGRRLVAGGMRSSLRSPGPHQGPRRERTRADLEALWPAVPAYDPEAERRATKAYLRAAAAFERELGRHGLLREVPGFRIHLGFCLGPRSPKSNHLFLWLPRAPAGLEEARRAVQQCVEALEVAVGHPVQIPQALADTPGALSYLLRVLNPHAWHGK